MVSKWNWDVRRLSNSEFTVNLPLRVALNLLTKRTKMQFITSNILAVVEETKLDPESFEMLESVWVRVVGIPKIAISEFVVMELASLVGDPEELHSPSLQWKSVWVKVASKNPYLIKGTSEVYINKQGKKISWFYSNKLSQFPPSKKPDDDDFDEDDSEITDEEDPESQESKDWPEIEKNTHQDNTNQSGGDPSSQHGKKHSNEPKDANTNLFVESSHNRDRVIQSPPIMLDSPAPAMAKIDHGVDQGEMLHSNTKSHDCQTLLGFSDIFQEMNKMASRINSKEQPLEMPNLNSSDGFSAEDSNLPLMHDATSPIQPSVRVRSTLTGDIHRQMVGRKSGVLPTDSPKKQVSPLKIRQSSRIQEKFTDMQDNAMAKKAIDKGISCSPNTHPPLASFNPLDSLARVCGFSLGFDDSSRLTNISLIQAKEEALLALHNVKNKLEVNTNTQQKDVNRVMPTNKRSVLPNTPQIELIEEGVNILANPIITDQR